MPQFIVDGEELIQKPVKKHGGGAIVYVPKAWVDEDVAIIRKPLTSPEAIQQIIKSKPSTTVYSYFVLDIVNKGHIIQMQNAKAAAGPNGISIVGIVGEKAVVKQKGKKPILTIDERIDLARSIRYNDFVVLQDEYSPINNITKMEPNIMMESASHSKEMIQQVKDTVRTWGGKVIVTPYYSPTSSTKIKNKIRRG